MKNLKHFTKTRETKKKTVTLKKAEKQQFSVLHKNKKTTCETKPKKNQQQR